MFRYIAKTLYLDLANDLQFGTDGIFINLLLKHTAILGFTPFVVCPLHLKLVIMWLLLGRLICSDGMLLIWWCKLDITFSRTLVNYPSALCFFLSFFFRLLLSVKKLACMLSAKTGMSSSPRTSRRATEPMWRSLRQTSISTNDVIWVLNWFHDYQ